MDDKDGTICNEGPFPIFNTIKSELNKKESTKKTKTNTTAYPVQFWSKKIVHMVNSTGRKCENAFSKFCLALLLSIILSEKSNSC